MSKYKLIVGDGYLSLKRLYSDNLTEKYSFKPIALNADLSFVKLPNTGELLCVENGVVVLQLVYNSLHLIVDPSGTAIPSVGTFALFYDFILRMQKINSNPPYSIELDYAASTTTVAANVNNSPLPAVGLQVIKVNCTVVSPNFTGMLTPACDEQKTIAIQNVGAANALDVKHEAAGSDAANRFLLPGGADMDINPNGTAIFTYDSTVSRWKLINIL